MSQRDLAAELRATRVTAPPELRERIRLITTADGTTPPPRRFTWRRALVVALPVAAAIAASIVFTRPSHQTAQTVVEHGIAHGSATFKSATTQRLAPAIGVPAPSPTRVQRYGANLTLRVPNATRVSDGVKRALRIARSLGGYATSVHATTAGRNAHAELTLKVPRTHVQEAVARLSALGTIAGEQVDLQDLQTSLNANDRTIAQLQRQLRGLRAQPSSLANDTRIAALVARIQKLQRAEAATIRSARYATIGVQLATPPVAHHRANTTHGRLHGVVVALTWLGIALVYALALGLPLLLLAAFGWLLLRTFRRRRDDALLSRS